MKDKKLLFDRKCHVLYDPDIIGYCWDDSNPRIQLEPSGNRGYIELRSVKKK